MSDWYSEDKATFGDRLAGAREQAGMTQDQLADRIGVKAKTVHAWEDDLSEPRANRLQMLAGILNVSLMWLLTGRGEGVTGPESDTAPVPEAVEEVLADLRLLRAEVDRIGDRMGLLEKRLRLWSKEAAK